MGSPYLISLGFSKPLIPFVWLAGPLAGVIGQPYFGLCSDQCRIRWGRRKVFIAGGALAIILSLPALAWAREIVHAVAWIVSGRQDHHALQAIIMIVAAILVWVLNFAIQPLQCGLRALIVETCPSEEIDTANAWASRMISIGSLLGYGSGFVDLSNLMHIEGGHTQFKVLSVLATCGMAVTVCVCCCTIRERDPSEDEPPIKELKGTINKAKHIYGSIFRIPPQVAMNIHPVDLVSQKTANQHGSLALLMFAFAQLLASIIAPSLITKPEQYLHPGPYTFINGKRTTLPRFLSRQLSTPWSSLCALWVLSHAIFAACMFSTLLVNSSVVGATILVGIVGISAALSQLVPFTLISLILSRHHEQAIHLAPSVDLTHALTAEKTTMTRYETQPGIIMGIHNMSIAAPQLIAAVGSSAIFWLFDGDGDGDGGDESRSTGWVLRAGGLAALAAIWMTLRLRDEVEDLDEDGLAFDALAIPRRGPGAESSYTRLPGMIPELNLGMDL
ncbi:General alpha-glucoside permease [Cytospora mali]|uniref:General alpha-glucoside permease n=1 Tax=Cytospora mali TaxID=578113 RepID=A0A194UXS9_CYTMA|nr:General alpha-glucoside permease [Valsa mali var. pyri (nom. inval.)]